MAEQRPRGVGKVALTLHAGRLLRVHVELISAPWALPLIPSIQTGALKAYLGKTLPHVQVRCAAAAFGIPFFAAGGGLTELVDRMSEHGELPYAILYARRFLGVDVLAANAPLPASASGRRLSKHKLALLDRATQRYVDSVLAPAPPDTDVRLFGFTVNYNQVYASAYLAALLRQRVREPSVAVYGGFSVGMPNILELLRRLREPGLVVIGEGEAKLAAIVERLTHMSHGGDFVRELSACEPGVLAIADAEPLYERPANVFATKLGALDALPLPCFDDYFAELRQACANDRVFAGLRARVTLPIEGSRGCFAKCDFCGLNYSWEGFRSLTGRDVLARTVALTERYETNVIQFMDNVCDAWAESFADAALAQNLRVDAFFELRAHHPERFWTRLALAGATAIQIGIEALASGLMLRMNKGTRAYQNIAAHKTLTELGIISASNLITHHPLSTVADVSETRARIELMGHLAPFNLARFGLVVGSPLYDRLDLAERRRLVPRRARAVPPELEPFRADFGYELPPELALSREVTEAWDEFARWYRGYGARAHGKLESVRLSPETTKITDSRRGGLVEHRLVGAEARLYDALHAGPTRARMREIAELTEPALERHLERFIEARLVVEADDRVVALACRHRDELVTRALAAPLARETSPLAARTPTADARPRRSLL